MTTRESSVSDCVLLLTSAAYAIASNTKITDLNSRVNRVIHSVYLFQSNYPDLRIVVCDGSGFDFSEVLSLNRNLEVIAFTYDQEKVRKLGKGFGEGEILSFAMNNSEFVANAVKVIKVTGGLFILNLESAIDMSADLQLYPKTRLVPFSSLIRIHRIDTRVFSFGKEIYFENLAEIHQNVNDSVGYFLEDAYFDACIQKNLLTSQRIMRRSPIIIGHSGSTGKSYGKNRAEFLMQFVRNLKIIFLRLSLPPHNIPNSSRG
jgi:hypothetical protein